MHSFLAPAALLLLASVGFFASPFAAASTHGTAGSRGAFTSPGNCPWTLPTGIRFYAGAPYLGNADFQISVTGVRPGSTFAQLWISEADWDPTLVKAFWDLLNQPPYQLGLAYPFNLQSRNLDEWLNIGYRNSPSPMYVDLFDLAGTGTFDVENVPGGAITGGGGVAGAPAYEDPANAKCGNNAYVGRFDAHIPIPNSPALAGLPRTVSDYGVIRIR